MTDARVSDALHGLRRAGLSTITQVLVCLEIMDAQLHRKPHTVNSLSRALDISDQTVSKVVKRLARDHELVRYVRHPRQYEWQLLELDIDKLVQASRLDVSALVARTGTRTEED